MARTKEFEREAVLQKAIQVFAEHGYEGTSTELLMRAMGISRQSMYDTFGDKRRLYLEALRYYNIASVSEIIRTLNAAAAPMKGIEAALLAFATETGHGAPASCLGVSAICEFGRSDPEVSLINDATAQMVVSAFEQRVGDARRCGDAAAEIDGAVAAQFLLATISGMKIAARGGADADVLRGIARMAIRSLK